VVALPAFSDVAVNVSTLHKVFPEKSIVVLLLVICSADSTGMVAVFAFSEVEYKDVAVNVSTLHKVFPEKSIVVLLLVI
jgi:hypothetical protein